MLACAQNIIKFTVALKACFYILIIFFPRQFKLEHAEFKEVLYGEDFKHKVQIKSLRLDREKRMTRTTLLKSGLTDIHIKMRVEWDRVTCEPLQKDGHFV